MVPGRMGRVGIGLDRVARRRIHRADTSNLLRGVAADAE